MWTSFLSPFSTLAPPFSGGAKVPTSVLLKDNLSWEKNKDVFTKINHMTISTFNLLAPCYKRMPESKRESGDDKIWTKRVTDTIEFCNTEIYGNSDIIGFQEYWLDAGYTELFDKAFDAHNYDVRHLKRTGKKMDSVVIAVKKDVFEIQGSENVYLCSINDRVALVLHLLHKATGKTVLIANTHLSFPHSSFDRVNQMQQMKKLTNAMSQYSTKNNIPSATRVVMGDFNVNSNSHVCDHLRKEGYFSCFEVCSPSNLVISDFSDTTENKVVDDTPVVEIDDLGFGDLRIDPELLPKSLISSQSSEWQRDAVGSDGGTSRSDTDVSHPSSPKDLSATQPLSDLPSPCNSYYSSDKDKTKSVSEKMSVSKCTVSSSSSSSSPSLSPSSSSSPSLTSSSSSPIPSSSSTSSFFNSFFSPGLNPCDSELAFVSHRTHDRNDVGVDHIFVKPELEIQTEIQTDSDSDYRAAISTTTTVAPPCPTPLSSSLASSPSSSSSSSSSPRRIRPKPSPPSSSSTSLSHDLQSPWSTVQAGLFITGSTVLPRSLVCDQWHETFTISDHRPVSSTLFFASRNREEEVKDGVGAVDGAVGSSIGGVGDVGSIDGIGGIETETKSSDRNL